MQLFFLVASLFAVTRGDLPGCGFRIQSRLRRPDGTYGGGCWLNAGHLYDATQHDAEDAWRHGLDAPDEYNVFWQCTGNIAGRTWYFEDGDLNSRVFTILPNKAGQFGEFFLRGDITFDHGVLVDANEVNAKVDQSIGATQFKIGYYNSGVVGAGILAYKRGVDGKWMRLQRDEKGFMYTLVTGQKVGGFEAKWQIGAVDASKHDNYVKIFAAPCGLGTSSAQIEPVNNINPVMQWPESNPMVLRVPGGQQTITYIVAFLFVLLLVNLAYFVYSCASKRKSIPKVYRAVHVDSDTDAV